MKSATAQLPSGVRLEMPRQRGPRTEVVPVEGAIGHDHIVRMLHQRVINGDFFNAGIFLGQHLGQLGRAGPPP